MPYRQDPPFAVQIELVEGCQLRCDFCGLNGIRGKENNFKPMSVSTAKRIASEIARSGWNVRIEFAMHGEPTYHPDYAGMIGIFRHSLPNHQLMMTSNGGGLLRSPGPVGNLKELFKAGLNVFAFDAYESVKIKEKVVPELESTKDLGFDIRYYPDDNDASPHKRWGPRSRVFIRVKDISVATEGNHSYLSNHVGAAAPALKDSLQKRCAKPFRELSFRWDGNVAICCESWRGQYKIGNINDLLIEEIWHHKRLDAARKFLILGDRSAISECSKCDARSYRVGLLPDKKGKVTLPLPTEKDRQIIREAEAGAPYTVPILRPWEK